MTVVQIVEDVLKVGRSNWENLTPDEREGAEMWGGCFAERMRSYVEATFPAQSIANDAAMYQALQDLSCLYCDREYPVENLSLCFAAWTFERRALTGDAVGAHDALARVRLLAKELEDGAFDEIDVLAAVRMVRKDMMAAIPLPSAQTAE